MADNAGTGIIGRALSPVSSSIARPIRYDGVTATVALADLHAIDADRLDWLVPGLIEEKCVDLIRTLPKVLRTNFVPVPEFAHRAVVRMPYAQGNLLAALAKDLGRGTGIQVAPSGFQSIRSYPTT